MDDVEAPLSPEEAPVGTEGPIRRSRRPFWLSASVFWLLLCMMASAGFQSQYPGIGWFFSVQALLGIGAGFCCSQALVTNAVEG